MSDNAKLLMDKIFYSYFGAPTVDQFMPAAQELCNLAGPGRAFTMMSPDGAGQFTVNFFNQLGYERNRDVNGRIGDEMLMEIYRLMNGPNNDPARRPGLTEFIDAFHPGKR
jgi:hypothetical protein